MHIPFAVFTSLALALPALTAPLGNDIKAQDVVARHSQATARTVASRRPPVATKGPRRLIARTVAHPSAQGAITLFHGTSKANADSIVANGPKISFTPQGDFNSQPDVPGGFYMSDSLLSAAQFACHESQRGSPDQVDVLEFTWQGASDVYEFTGITDEWHSFVNYNLGTHSKTDAFHARAVEIFQNVMVSGPMNGPDDFDLTDQFFQYAVVNQDAATNRLKERNRHEKIICAKVPKGNALTDNLYTATQGGNSQFAVQLATLQAPAAV
ncbi:hypothetical protein FB451DRAFT_1369913 [Mycena latifolia]|nr:hypothetical protein FB451DRAFT_1369913 [Mycena latifolia]